ncbi:VOC family protein [Actinoplanes sp. TFC3]|uniref:VOC family protein n=1 Tax=Actinoplanes sp. TFC3 TaxID=1710355 RepID=UPI000832907D|nr:VOC family protein [Actinoplanes sp. TFC3]
MNFVSIRVITEDVARLVGFYERVTGLKAAWATEDFAQLQTESATLAIGSTRTVGPFAQPGQNRSVLIEFLVDDVDALFKELDEDVVQEPATMPWGNRSLLLRDPDGNVVNLFSRPPA